jgi:hypothetical protein
MGSMNSGNLVSAVVGSSPAELSRCRESGEPAALVHHAARPGVAHWVQWCGAGTDREHREHRLVWEAVLTGHD